MVKTNASVTNTDDDGTASENFLFTYSEEEKQQNEISNSNAKLVFSPEFIPFYGGIQRQYDLSDTETKLYGFIRFYLSNASDRFYFTNEQLAEVLYTSTVTVSKSIQTLSRLGIIKCNYKMKANGGQIRFIDPHDVKIFNVATLSKLTTNVKKVNGNNNKIKDNKINNNNTILHSKQSLREYTINSNISLVSDGELMNQLISMFKSINPSYKNLYSNKTQRGALERMVKEHGFDKMREVIDCLPEVVTQPYAPQISTPSELETKFGRLVIYLQQTKTKGLKGGVGRV